MPLRPAARDSEPCSLGSALQVPRRDVAPAARVFCIIMFLQSRLLQPPLLTAARLGMASESGRLAGGNPASRIKTML